MVYILKRPSNNASNASRCLKWRSRPCLLPYILYIMLHITMDRYSAVVFFFFFWIQVYCPLRQGLMSDFTFDYATLWLPVSVSPLPPWPSSASSQGSPQVITPCEDPAQKCCFQMHHDRNVHWHSTDWVDLLMLASFIHVMYFFVHPIAYTIGTMS